MEKHLTPADLAERLGCSESTLDKMRHTGKGPRFLKFGAAKQARVRYRLSDVLAWEEANTHDNTGRAA